MIRAVLDTNIFISSIFWEHGNPHKIIELAVDKKIQVFSSVEILKEMENSLKRDFMEQDDFIQRQINLILEYATIVEPQRKVDIIKEDSADNKILECGITSNADYIVTGDKHLLKLKEFEGIKIINAKEFTDIIR